MSDFDTRNRLEVSDGLDNEGELAVDMICSMCDYNAAAYLTKENAINLINHLTHVFHITPEDIM